MLKINRKNIKRALKFLRKNYILTILFAIIAFVILLFIISLLIPPSYVYAKIKVGQGYGWASPSKPNIWLINSIKKGQSQYNILGSPIAEVESIRYYPLGTGHEMYVVAKLKVKYNKRTRRYTFNRYPLMINGPIELELSGVNITGTVIDLKRTPFNDKYVNKTVSLLYKSGYNKGSTYRYDNIKIGDKYFDGEDVVFEVLDKSLEKNIWLIENNLNAELYEREIDTTQDIILKVRLKLQEKNDGLYYAEEYRINTNSSIPFLGKDYFFDGFVVTKVE